MKCTEEYRLNSEQNIAEPIPFRRPLTSRQRKYFVEHFALEILKYCFGHTYDSFFVSDKPDIQNGEKRVGIEVTEAITREEAQIDGEFAKYQFEKEKKAKERRKTIIEANGGKVDKLGITYPVKNSNIEKRIFQNAISIKMGKLASYKEQGFSKVGLFIYYDEPPIPFKIEELKLYYDEILNQYQEKYDLIYFVYPCGLVCYNVTEDNIYVIKIGRENYERLQYEARAIVEEKYM